MDSSRMLVALGFVVYFLGQVAPAFVPTSLSTRAPPKLGGLPGSAPLGRQPGSESAGATLLAVAAGAVAGAAATLRRHNSRASAVKRQADLSGLLGGGPVVAYCKALTDAAAAKGESVPVTKDLQKLKELMSNEPGHPFMQAIAERNSYDFTQKMEAELIVKSMADFGAECQSTVFPKFLIFLAKKQRLIMIGRIMDEYIQTLYLSQSVAPVKVTCATPLTDDEKAKIKEKMKAKVGVDDIKLVVEYSAELIAGFKLEWGYSDPDVLDTPSYVLDYSLKTHIEDAAVEEGILVA